MTALLFTIGKFAIGLYIGKSAIASGFGAAGSIVVVLVWVYYSAQIFLFGAEFTWVYAHTFGSRKGQPRPGGAEEVPQRGSALAPVKPNGQAPAAVAVRTARHYAPLRARTGVDAPLAFGVGCLLTAIVARLLAGRDGNAARRLQWRPE